MAFLATVAFWGLTWGQVINAVVIIASAAYSLTNRPSSGGGKFRQTAASLDKGQLQNTRTISAPTPLIYGHTRVGLNQVYLGVSGTDNQYLHIIGNLGEGELNAISQSAGVDQVWLEDKLYTEYPGLVTYEFFNGSSTQIACATLNTAIPEWNEPKKYTAYIYMSLKYDRDKFQAMPGITIELEGLKIYNPDTAVTEYSNNPALCALDFMTRSSRRGGMGIDIARIDLDSVIDSATYCDTKGWTCDLYLNENQSASDNFLQILATFRGVLVYSESEFKLKYRDLNYESAVMNLDEDDVVEQGVSSLKIIQPSIFSTPNAINCKFINSEKKFTQDDYVLADSTAITADGDYREEQIDLWGVTSQTNVMKLANYYLERLRINKSASLMIGSRGLALEPFDLVTLTHSRPGWSSKQFRVTNVSASPDATVALSLEEETAAMYDDTYNLDEHSWYDTDLPHPTDTVPAVINVSNSEELYDYRDRTFTRWKINFDKPAAADYIFWDYADIWTRIGIAGDWKFMTKSEGDYVLDPVEEGVTYYCRIVSVSIFGTRQAFADGYTISRMIEGKTAAPASVINLTAVSAGDTVTIFATELSEADIAGYEIRMGDSWDGGLYVAFNETPNFRLVGVRPATLTFWIKAKDNAGNYSGTADSATVEVFYPSGYVDVATWAWDFDAIGTHDNTEHETYELEDAIKCSHAASTELMPNAVDRDFSGASAWANVDVDAYNETDDLTITASGANQYCTCPVLSMPTTAGLRYKLKFDVDNLVATWTIKSFDGTQTIGTVTADGLQQEFDWTATTTGGLRLVAVGATSSGDFDNFTLTRYYTALTGRWTSPEYDMLSVIPFRIWGDFRTSLEASSGTWAALFLSTWDVAITATTRWYELIQPDVAGSLTAKLFWGDVSGSLSESAEKLELLGIEIEARYVKVEITITDPDDSANLHLKTLNMTTAYW